LKMGRAGLEPAAR